MAKEKNQAAADQAAADQAAADQAAADQAAADQAAADQAAVKVEAVLLRDSNLGNAGDIVSIKESEVAAYTLHGILDVHPDAVSYAKSQQQQ